MSTVQSVERALKILEIISNHDKGLGITEISERTQLHKSTVHRLLQTLIYTGYVIQDEETKNYILSFKMYSIGIKKVESLDVIEIARPYLEDLCKNINETIHLVIRDDAEVIYIDKVEADNTINMSSKVGRRSTIYSTSVGKALIAHEDEDLIEELWEKSDIVEYTENTITDLDQFKKELSDVRKLGYAVDNEENEFGVRCVGAPIFDSSGNAVAAVSISGPTIRMIGEKDQRSKEYIRYYSSMISNKLGYIR